jgi:hypothetical protein
MVYVWTVVDLVAPIKHWKVYSVVSKKKIDTVASFVVMQWHAISESLTERPLRTEVVLDTLTSVSKPCDGWNVEAGIFIPSGIDATGTWGNLIEGNTPSSRNEMTRCDETALLKDENEDSKLIEKVDALQDVSEESELGDAIVSNTESKIEHAREVTSDREPVLCRGPGHVRE